MQPDRVATVGDVVVLRWRDPEMPDGMDGLIEAAVAAGYGWMGDFPGEWRQRPFLADGEALFLAERERTIVGMAAISADPHVLDRTTGRLRFIFVAEAARGRGLLRCFVEACLSHGAARWRRIRLHTDNPMAARVYERYGFVPTASQYRSTHMRGSL